MAETMDVVMEGVRIKKIVPVPDVCMEYEGWETDRIDGRAAALVLENGVVLYPSRDPEGNGPGWLFGMAEGRGFHVHPSKEVTP